MSNRLTHRSHPPRAALPMCSLAAAALLALLAGCGSSADERQTVQFTDGPIVGLDVSGQTSGASRSDAAGQISCAPGESLGVAIGNLALGSATCTGALSALALTPGATSAADQRVNNKLILLQTLDADGDLNNGIQITDAIRGIVSAQAAAINFAQTPTAFRTSLAPLMTALNNASAFTDTDPRPRSVRAAAAALEHYGRATAPRHVVTTTHGQLSGFEANAGTWQFLGIPYAKPPLGELRWRPPQALAPWSGVRQAVAWADQSAQTPAMQAINEGGMSEDSLYLNVTAPKNASKLPVMVWLHGGAFATLSGNSKQYNNPASLTTKGVVLVTVNHRLGPFGYLSHPALTAESGYNGSGNYGQMDLVMALTWVKNNIAAFGGDPGSVTVFGQSGGGGKTFSLMNSPQAKGLFHKAIVQSGANPLDPSSTPASSLAANEAIGSALFARLGVTTLAQARALPWTAIAQSDVDNNIPREIYRPNVDAYYLPKTYHRTAQDGLPVDVPLMVGATDGDYSSLRAALPVFMAQRAATYKSPQYVYKFSRVPSGWAAMGLLSGHGGELPYLFNYPAGMVSNYTLNLALTPAGAKPPIGDLNGNGTTGTAGDTADIYASMAWGAADTAMVDTMMTLWTNFAKTGVPNTATLSWPAYTPANDSYLEFGAAATTVKTGLAKAFP